MKNVVIVSTSLRKNSNSEILAREFGRGAMQSGNNVEHISLIDKSIGFCIGCLACQRTGSCVIKDDAVAIAEKIKNAEVLVFATPIYYYEMSGQMKTLLDRCNPIFGTSYKFREVYFLATAADYSDSAMDGALHGMQGWIDCFQGVSLKGVIRAVGVTDAGEINGTPILGNAYEAGKRV